MTAPQRLGKVVHLFLLAGLTASVAGCGGSDTPAATAPVPAPAPASAVAVNTKATLALLETTDLHTNVMSYDYFKLAEDPSLGLERTATLINAARAEFPNNLLLDNGDTIQGTALSDYQALVKPTTCSETLAIYKVMNQIRFDGGGIGNHEFNYGLPYLNQVTGSTFNVDSVTNGSAPCAGPQFPQVLANVYSAKTKAPLFTPYQIITRLLTAKAPDGRNVQVPVKIGIIGFTPPTIMAWDKRWLDGKVYTQGLVETATQFIPEMRSKGAELVVAISHGGLDNSAYAPDMENGNWHLSKVPGIDAMLIGHSHQVFPDATSTVGQFNLPGVDKVKGTVNGVPTVMANFWGKHLGVVKLKNLKYKGVAIDANAFFIIATNNYRASGGGNFPGIDGSKTIYASPDANRDVLISYIKAAKALTRAKNGSDRSWRFTPVTTAGRVTFKSAPAKLALATAAGLTNISAINSDDGSGKSLADYAIDLSK